MIAASTGRRTTVSPRVIGDVATRPRRPVFFGGSGGAWSKRGGGVFFKEEEEDEKGSAAVAFEGWGSEGTDVGGQRGGGRF